MVNLKLGNLALMSDFKLRDLLSHDIIQFGNVANSSSISSFTLLQAFSLLSPMLGLLLVVIDQGFEHVKTCCICSASA